MLLLLKHCCICFQKKCCEQNLKSKMSILFVLNGMVKVFLSLHDKPRRFLEFDYLFTHLILCYSSCRKTKKTSINLLSFIQNTNNRPNLKRFDRLFLYKRGTSPFKSILIRQGQGFFEFSFCFLDFCFDFIVAFFLRLFSFLAAFFEFAFHFFRSFFYFISAVV